MECRGEVEERTGRGREGKPTQIQFYKHTKISHCSKIGLIPCDFYFIECDYNNFIYEIYTYTNTYYNLKKYWLHIALTK